MILYGCIACFFGAPRKCERAHAHFGAAILRSRCLYACIFRLKSVYAALIRLCLLRFCCGPTPDTPLPPAGRRWLLRSRAAGSESPVPCSSPDLADGNRLRRRLLRSLSDGSHPSSTQEHGSEPSIPPVLLLLKLHRVRQPLAVSATSCCPISSAPRSPSAARAL